MLANQSLYHRACPTRIGTSKQSWDTGSHGWPRSIHGRQTDGPQIYALITDDEAGKQEAYDY